MVEQNRQIQENLINSENSNNLEKRASLAFDKVEELTETIIADLGEDRWKSDRFGKTKEIHMKEMADEAEEIWGKYGLTQDNELKDYLPLFKFMCRSHDIGRHYDKTRKDENGRYIDHGELGVLIMNENGVLDDFKQSEKEMVEYIVKNHSIREMNEAKNDNERKAQQLCQIFRDRDKVEVINKRDFVEAKKIYRIIPKHFESGKFRDNWVIDPNNSAYEFFVERSIDGEKPRAFDEKSALLKKIIEKPFQNEVKIKIDEQEEVVNLLESFSKKESIPYAVCQESGSYTTYLVYLMSYMGGIEYQESIDEIDTKEVKAKMNFIEDRMTRKEFGKFKKIIKDVYKINI